jgi:hypothetical protein
LTRSHVDRRIWFERLRLEQTLGAPKFEELLRTALSPRTSGSLGERFVADMALRGFIKKTRKDYLRIVACFAAFLERSPGTAPAEHVCRF